MEGWPPNWVQAQVTLMTAAPPITLSSKGRLHELSVKLHCHQKRANGNNNKKKKKTVAAFMGVCVGVVWVCVRRGLSLIHI